MIAEPPLLAGSCQVSAAVELVTFDTVNEPGAAGTSAEVDTVNTEDVEPWPKLVIADIRNL